MLVLAVMGGLAGVASGQASPSALPAAMRLDSAWLFHASAAIAAFMVLYLLGVLLALTVSAGGPPHKLAIGGLSYETATVDVLTDGAASLDAINTQLTHLNAHVAGLTAVARTTQEMLAPIADEDLGDHARQQLAELDRIEQAASGSAQDTTVGGAKDFLYDAFVKDASLHSGKIYAVNITVVSVTGGTATRSEKLLLHRTFPHG
jgi:hypothetical protein